MSNEHSNLVDYYGIFQVFWLRSQSGWLSSLGAKQRSLNFRLADGCFGRIFSPPQSSHSNQRSNVLLELCFAFVYRGRSYLPSSPTLRNCSPTIWGAAQ